MAEKFRLDPEGVKVAAARLGNLGERLQGAVRDLELTLTERHGCWGSDDIGEAFAKNYVESSDEAREGAQMATEGTVRLRDEIDKTVAFLEQQDEANAARIDASMGQGS
ncbi:WXG100 family type VII secretion target [Amycolatopsis japonica]|uniref:WXG100 family type VII secretion target n=1 Tax=Amycolatopsis japonica TaxID=208439 RepID=UPI00366C7226